MGDPPGQESSRNALIDARCPLSDASGDGGAPRPFFGGRGNACGGARLLQPPQEAPFDDPQTPAECWDRVLE